MRGEGRGALFNKGLRGPTRTTKTIQGYAAGRIPGRGGVVLGGGTVDTTSCWVPPGPRLVGVWGLGSPPRPS